MTWRVKLTTGLSAQREDSDEISGPRPNYWITGRNLKIVRKKITKFLLKCSSYGSANAKWTLIRSIPTSSQCESVQQCVFDSDLVCFTTSKFFEMSANFVTVFALRAHALLWGWWWVCVLFRKIQLRPDSFLPTASSWGAYGQNFPIWYHFAWQVYFLIFILPGYSSLP